MTGFVFPLVLLANGLASGVLIWGLLGGWPLMRSLSNERYVQLHAFFATRYDPFMPACMLVTIAGDALLGWRLPGGASVVLVVAAAALTGCGIVVSLVKNVPVNKWVLSLDPENLPADFPERDPRMGWGWWNRQRSLLVIAAFLANCVALGLVL
ncbi:hypothetical protein GCM10022222_79550 [Amycolatopsis ultiminotia]|uniref:DUF1772 domain-containing protein n=1 Tax=Amycolatopsis ultiminotia TaxID=543629 RepID=A0ABP6YFW6_9PSEU